MLSVVNDSIYTKADPLVVRMPLPRVDVRSIELDSLFPERAVLAVSFEKRQRQRDGHLDEAGVQSARNQRRGSSAIGDHLWGVRGIATTSRQGKGFTSCRFHECLRVPGEIVRQCAEMSAQQLESISGCHRRQIGRAA